MLRTFTLGLVALTLGCASPPSSPTPQASRSEPPATVAVSPSPAPSAACPPVRALSPGAISGRLSYPSEFIPKLVVFAVRADGSGSYRMLHTVGTPPGPPSYTMAAVEPGTYTVLAYVDGPNSLSAAYTAAVICGLGANCADHSLARVTVRSGETVTGIDILDWNGTAGFPSRPAGSEFPSGESVRICNPYADSVNVRASAGLGFPVRRTLDNGSAVVVRDGPLPADGYDWYEVSLASDQLARGWVVGYALRK